jgi:hypothetical protein
MPEPEFLEKSSGSLTHPYLSAYPEVNFTPFFFFWEGYWSFTSPINDPNVWSNYDPGFLYCICFNSNC